MHPSPPPHSAFSTRRSAFIHRCRSLPISLSPLLLVFLLPACVQDATDLQAAHDQALATLDQARTRESQLARQLTTLPATDPLRLQLQPQLDQLDQFIATLQQEIPKLDAALKAQPFPQTLDPTLQQTLSTLPYGSLALALLGLTFGALKHAQASTLLSKHQQSQKAFAQIVQALDSLVPAPTPDQQSKLNAALDTDVKAQLAAARA